MPRTTLPLDAPTATGALLHYLPTPHARVITVISRLGDSCHALLPCHVPHGADGGKPTVISYYLYRALHSSVV